MGIFIVRKSFRGAFLNVKQNKILMDYENKNSGPISQVFSNVKAAVASR